MSIIHSTKFTMTGDIQDSAVTTAKINDNAVTTAKINDLAVTTAKINTDAVTTAKILDANVTTAKIANDSITAVKMDESSYGSDALINLGITTSVASSQLTVGLVSADGTALSATNIGIVGFRNATATTGTPSLLKLTAAPTSVVTIATSTLGFVSGSTHYLYVYLFNDGGTAKLGISQNGFLGNGSLQSSTAMAASSNSNAIIYTANGISAVSSKAVRLIARIKFSLTTAGTWDEAGDELTMAPFDLITPSALYTTNTATAVTSGNAIPFEDLVEDTHGMYNTGTGVITIPVSGKWKLSCVSTSTAVVASAGNVYAMTVAQTGSVTRTYISAIDTAESATSRAFSATLDVILGCVAGDTITVKFNESIPAVNLNGDATQNWLNISRIGA